MRAEVRQPTEGLSRKAANPTYQLLSRNAVGANLPLTEEYGQPAPPAAVMDWSGVSRGAMRLAERSVDRRISVFERDHLGSAGLVLPFDTLGKKAQRLL
jgi:hypothetical protein